MRAQLFGFALVLLAIVPMHAAVAAATAKPTPTMSARACVPIVPNCQCLAFTLQGEREKAVQTEANIYNILPTIIWAIMWIIIAFIAKGAVVAVVEGTTPKQY